MTQTVMKVYSDNFEGELLTFDAYRELRLQMSTGDFHTHKAIVIEVSDDTNVLTIEDLE